MELFIQPGAAPLGQGIQLFAQACPAHTLLRAEDIRIFGGLSGHGFGQGKEAGLYILENSGKQAVIVFSIKGAIRNTVNPDIAFRGAVEPAQQLDKSGLSGAVEAYQSDFLPGPYPEADVVKGIAAGTLIPERDMLEGNFRRCRQMLLYRFLPAAVLFGQIHITAVITDVKAGRADAVPFVHDIADKGGKHGNGGKIQEKTVHGNAAFQGHLNQQDIGGAVPEEDDE